jgi:hypothetical protein
MNEPETWARETRELERRLLDAAEALLVHRGTGSAVIPFPGRLPACCVAIGDLAGLREMLKPISVQA